MESKLIKKKLINSSENDIKIVDPNNERKIFLSENLVKNQEEIEESSICWSIVCLSLMFLISGLSVYILWFTNLYHTSIYQHTALRNDSQALEWFKESPIHPILTVRIFNYTNTKEFLAGNETKLKIQEVGPFVYNESFQRIIQKYDKNKITYQEFRNHVFLTKESGGNKESDEVIVPNAFLIAAYEKAKNVFGGRTLVKVAKHATGSELFKKISVKEFLWGYRDDLMDKLFQFDNFGMIKDRRGINPGQLTVNTGEGNIKELMKLEALNHQSHLNFWKSKKCNALNGSTDGTQFPIHWIQQKLNSEIYIKYFCRKFPIQFHSEETILGNIPVHRYKPPKNMYSPSKLNPDNKCYELNEKYVIEGILQDNPCAQNASMVVSYPHFYLGGSRLLEPFEGLTPNEQDHGMIADYHNQLGILLGGHSRFQINFLVEGNSLDTGIKNDTILPILWVQESFGQFPEHFYLSLIVATISYVILMVLILRKKWKLKQQTNVSK